PPPTLPSPLALHDALPICRFLMAASAFGLISTTFPSPSDPVPPTGTIFDRLNAHGISWKNYFVDLPEIGLFPYVLEGNPTKVARSEGTRLNSSHLVISYAV